MRIVWAGLGAAVAVAVLYQVGRARSAVDSVARTLTPQGMAEALTQGVAELRLVGRELREAMTEREGELTRDLLPPPEVVAHARTVRATPARAAVPEDAPVDALDASTQRPDHLLLRPRGRDFDPWDDEEF